MSGNVVGRAVVRVDGEVDTGSVQGAADDIERIMGAGGEAAATDIEQSFAQIAFPRELGGFNESLDAASGTAREFGGGFGDLVTAMDTFGLAADGAGANVARVFEGIEAGSQVFGGLSDILNTSQAAYRALSTATNLSAGAQAALNAVMAINPIFLVVAAIAALVAGFVVAYKRSETFRRIVDRAFNAVRNVVVAVTRTVGNVIRNVWAAILAVTRNLGATIRAVWNGIRSGITASVNAVRSVVTAVFNGLRSYITAVFGAYRAVALAVWNAIRSGVTAAVNAIRSAVTGSFNAIRSVASSVWNRVRSTVTSAVNGVRSAVTSAFNAVRSTVTGVWNSVESTISGAWTRIRSAVTSGVSSVLAAVRGLPGQILSALGNLGSLLFNAGRDVVRGLADGLVAMKDFLLDRARDLLGPLGRLLPGSPVREGPLTVLNNGYAGREIARMIADGMRDGVPDVVGAGTSLAAAAVPTVRPDVATTATGPVVGRPGGAVAGRATVVQNYYGPTTSTGRRRETEWALRFAPATNTADGIGPASTRRPYSLATT